LCIDAEPEVNKKHVRHIIWRANHNRTFGVWSANQGKNYTHAAETWLILKVPSRGLEVSWKCKSNDRGYCAFVKTWEELKHDKKIEVIIEKIWSKVGKCLILSGTLKYLKDDFEFSNMEAKLHYDKKECAETVAEYKDTVIDVSAKKSTEKPTEKATDKPVEESTTEKSTDKSTEQVTEKSQELTTEEEEHLLQDEEYEPMLWWPFLIPLILLLLLSLCAFAVWAKKSDKRKRRSSRKERIDHGTALKPPVDRKKVSL